MRRWLQVSAALLVATGLVTWGVVHYLTAAPGASHAGPLPQLTAEERTLAATLKRHVETIAAAEHNIEQYDELEEVALYLERTLQGYGFTTVPQRFETGGKTVRNIEVVIEPAAGTASPEVIVVGAHYDTAANTPGANDNASGTAAVLELARLLRDLHGRTPKRLRLVLFVNEEPPYYRTSDMGSVHYARMLAEAKERVTAMYSIETVGFFSDAPGSQSFPPPFGVLFPDRADFISFVGLTGSRSLVRETLRSFRSHTGFPSIGGVAPDIIPGIGWSDHWAFAQHGFQALMVTDTAVYRYPHYHEPTDTPDKVDTEKVARIVKGMERVIRDAMR